MPVAIPSRVGMGLLDQVLDEWYRWHVDGIDLCEREQSGRPYRVRRPRDLVAEADINDELLEGPACQFGTDVETNRGEFVGLIEVRRARCREREEVSEVDLLRCNDVLDRCLRGVIAFDVNVLRGARRYLKPEFERERPL